MFDVCIDSKIHWLVLFGVGHISAGVGDKHFAVAADESGADDAIEAGHVVGVVILELHRT